MLAVEEPRRKKAGKTQERTLDSRRKLKADSRPTDRRRLKVGSDPFMEVELYKEYKEQVVPALKQKHGYKNIHQVPSVEKVVINACVGSSPDVKAALEEAKKEIATITGQKPMETRAKKSIANFKLRENQAIGAKVTLRGAAMYEFLERLIKTALPRIRDFRGVSPRRSTARAITRSA